MLGGIELTYEIDEIRKVPLSGLAQKIHIRGEKLANPVLLFCTAARASATGTV